jgi:hypothetical protein
MSSIGHKHLAALGLTAVTKISLRDEKRREFSMRAGGRLERYARQSC